MEKGLNLTADTSNFPSQTSAQKWQTGTQTMEEEDEEEEERKGRTNSSRPVGPNEAVRGGER